MLTLQFPCDHVMRGVSKQGQQEPRMSQFQDAGKSNSKVSGPTNKRKNYRRPR